MPSDKPQKSAAPLRVGIAGLGVVGGEVARQISHHGDTLAAVAGRDFRITVVSARSRDADRGFDMAGIDWVDNAAEIAERDDVDIVVEMIGGEEGVALDLVTRALETGKHVITANKAMLAHHGTRLAGLAEANNVGLMFEAAIAGGIPAVKSLREGLAGNRVSRVSGILNGTCNYILTRMEATGQGYNALFDEANKLGYLEADPNLDVGGIDAGHKLSLLSSIAFGTQVDFDGVELEGIQRITLEDIRAAADMGYRVKLLGVAQMTERGLEQRMSPCLVPADSPLGQLEGGTNMVVIEGDSVGQIVLRGAGAGEGPTASAVMGDICDVARGFRYPVFGQPASTLAQAPRAQSATPAPYYLRMSLRDKPGALAKVASVLGEAGVSIHRMRQYDHVDDIAPVLLVTHETTRADLDTALEGIANTDAVTGAPVALRIETV